MENSFEEVIEDLLSGNSHMRAWVAIVNVLNECVPDWSNDYSKSTVENAVATIRRLATIKNSNQQ